MYPNFKDYFYFNQVEKKGVILLLVILLLLIGVNVWMSNQSQVITHNSSKIQEGLAYLDSIAEASKDNNRNYEEVEPKNQILNLTEFDPNEFSVSEFQKLGLSKKQASIIENYRNKGGVFKSKSDFKKMYSISDELYQKLEPYILLPDTFIYANTKRWEKKDYSKNRKTWKPAEVYLNTSDSATFTKLRGIGPTYASRIIKYRTRLGGFRSINQLTEVYGITDSLVQTFGEQLKLDTIPIVKLNVNELTAKELKVNPYIDWSIANSIVAYREQHGKYKKLEDIKKSVLINDSLYNKLKYYLDIR
ncbi:MAG: hypothetical protein DWP98_12170 [Bacteroidetes bacterium]|nr:MAG: hypothetical protein DWP98_12170 [Bacteroidota bacterium]MBL1145659.1 hypothetical protein [Bacteroidota bacterium]MCB0802284.1 helix-hairpin-helix domain-containing protein [Flavobacteriales bacterium]NOG58453.1 hypothetical protein [Bacteroidota bacterium]